MLLRDLTRAAVLAAAVFVLAAAPAIPAESLAPLAEDIDFGCGLLDRKFHALAIEILEARMNDIEEAPDRERVLKALIAANDHLSRVSRPDLTAEQEKRLREGYAKRANELRLTLSKIGPSSAPTSFDGLMRLREEVTQKQQQVATAPSEELRKSFIDQMIMGYEEVIRGFDKLAEKAKTALRVHEEAEPDSEAARKRWEEKLPQLQGQYLFSAVELNRTRHMLYKLLPPTETKRRDELLKKVIEELEQVCGEFDMWQYAIIGNVTLARAYLDARKFADAKQTCEPAIALIDELLKKPADAEFRKGMVYYRTRLLETSAIASARLGEFDKGIDLLKGLADVESRLVLGEIHLMKAQELAKKKDEAKAQAAQAQAKAVLDEAAKQGDYWERLVTDLYRRYAVAGTDVQRAFDELKEAVDKRIDNATIISRAFKFLAFGDEARADRRIYAFEALGMIFRQERMFYEAYVVYAYLASRETGEKFERYSTAAVAVLQSQAKASGSDADRVLLAAARKQLGVTVADEYFRGVELKEEKSYADAVRSFEQVKPDSFYYEAALVQIGECATLEAHRIRKTDPAGAGQLLAKAKTALIAFLKRADEKTDNQRLLDMRNRFKAVAVFRLADIDMWEGKEDAKSLIARTEDFAARFPDAPSLHPYIAYFRTRAFLLTGDLAKAEIELELLRRALAQPETRQQVQKMVNHCSELMFRAYAQAGDDLTKEAENKTKQAKDTADPKKKQELLDAAAETAARANENVQNALNIVTAAIASNPDQPYDKLYYVVFHLMRLKEYHKVPPYIEMFVNKFGNNPRYAKDVAAVRAMLGTAYYHSGQYKLAYDATKARLAELERTYAGEAKKPAEYWSCKLYLAKAGKELDEHRAEALDIFLDLQQRLERFSEDWWDVMVSIAEVRNAASDFKTNLFVIRRYISAQPGLGGRAIRMRYFAVLEKIYRGAGKDEHEIRKQALEMLLLIQETDLKELREAGNHREMVRIIRDFRFITLDYGGAASRAVFREHAQFVAQNAADDDLKKEAAQLVDELKD